jgi:[ribosomal protein S5]-alanine N-acetyltransferase
METLETVRMILRPLELADAVQSQRIFAHWEIVRFMNSRFIPWPYPVDGVLTYYKDVALPGIERSEEWHWTLRLKSDPGLVIGSISLRKREGHNRGFWIGLEWQGKGLMTEAANVVTDYWFDVLGFPVLRAPKAVANLASRRISERSGMRVVATEETEYVGGRFQTETWEITAEEWRARRGGGR